MAGRYHRAERDSLLRRSAAAYLDSPSSVYLTGSGLGVAMAVVFLLVLGGV